ncbi:hypothetical protein [Paenibacillus sp. QZ-Y1]|uniref:hypothetical protein n=1 Tax=Paenibacillus sp. QZ-Y1 TaxID=3414511 RepID=UPI003F792C78
MNEIELYECFYGGLKDGKLEKIKQALNWEWDCKEFNERLINLYIKSNVREDGGVSSEWELTTDNPKEGFRLATWIEHLYFTQRHGYPHKPLKLAQCVVHYKFKEYEDYTSMSHNTLIFNNDPICKELEQVSLRMDFRHEQ